MTTDFKRNSSGRTRRYEYSPPPPINALVSPRLEKAKRDRKDPYLSLLEQRNTQVANYKSPAQLPMRRRLRSLLPCPTNQLIPETVC